ILESDVYKKHFEAYKPNEFARDFVDLLQDLGHFSVVQRYVDVYAEELSNLWCMKTTNFKGYSPELTWALLLYSSETHNKKNWYGKWNSSAAGLIHRYCVKFEFSKKKTRELVFAVQNLNRFITDSLKGKI